jgi:hypothetical protein
MLGARRVTSDRLTLDESGHTIAHALLRLRRGRADRLAHSLQRRAFVSAELGEIGIRGAWLYGHCVSPG